MSESKIEGHHKDVVTKWYNKAYNNVLSIKRNRRSVILMHVVLEVARWSMLTEADTATNMLDWGVNHINGKSLRGDRDKIKYKEMKKELEIFKHPTLMLHDPQSEIPSYFSCYWELA